MRIALAGAALVFAAASAAAPTPQGQTLSPGGPFAPAAKRAEPLDGLTIFRFDTFGDERLWTAVLRMHEAVRSVDPLTALAVGRKVDVEALPPALIAALRAGQVDLTDPAVTIELLRHNAVVGVIGS